MLVILQSVAVTTVPSSLMAMGRAVGTVTLMRVGVTVPPPPSPPPMPSLVVVRFTGLVALPPLAVMSSAHAPTARLNTMQSASSMVTGLRRVLVM